MRPELERSVRAGVVNRRCPDGARVRADPTGTWTDVKRSDGEAGNVLCTLLKNRPWNVFALPVSFTEPRALLPEGRNRSVDERTSRNEAKTGTQQAVCPNCASDSVFLVPLCRQFNLQVRLLFFLILFYSIYSRLIGRYHRHPRSKFDSRK